MTRRERIQAGSVVAVVTAVALAVAGWFAYREFTHAHVTVPNFPGYKLVNINGRPWHGGKEARLQPGPTTFFFEKEGKTYAFSVLIEDALVSPLIEHESQLTPVQAITASGWNLEGR